MSEGFDDRDYDVGYGKPPKRTQFKKGKSGNPKGRPKASKNVGKVLEETFYRKIKISENGVQREVTMLEAIFRQVVNGAVKGDFKHVDRVLKLLPLLQETLAAEELRKETGDQPDPNADAAVLAALADMLGGDADDLFATVQKGIDDDSSED